MSDHVRICAICTREGVGLARVDRDTLEPNEGPGSVLACSTCLHEHPRRGRYALGERASLVSWAVGTRQGGPRGGRRT